jgi:glutathione synthase/RimK-type ligase-like ATP-grasp enzyme
MTNVLLISNKTDVTTDFIVRELVQSGISFYRLNTEEVGENIKVSFDFDSGKFLLIDEFRPAPIDLLDFSSVYFRRPGLKGSFTDINTAEANFLRSELTALLNGMYKILQNSFWLNTPENIRVAENKIYQLILAKELGFDIPASLITNSPQHALSFHAANQQESIIKPMKSGMVEAGREEGIIYTSKLSLNQDNVERISGCPVFLQKLVAKEADIRITVVGNRLFAAKIDSQTDIEARVDWRRTKSELGYFSITLPPEITERCLQLNRRLNLNFSAIDLILDTAGNYIFLEINPNGQWAWIERKLNVPIAKTITKILIERKA